MLGRSVTFRPESIEKRSQRGTLKNLTTPTCKKVKLMFEFPSFMIVGRLVNEKGLYAHKAAPLKKLGLAE